MRINWGTGIVLAIIAFICFIMYMVVAMSTSKNFEHDLVVEEYYKQELSFQDQLDKESNSQNLAEDISTTKSSEGIFIDFPSHLDFSQIEGDLLLYRPSNKKLDLEIPLELKSHSLKIPNHLLVEGRWNIVVDWSYKGEFYLFRKEITY